MNALWIAIGVVAVTLLNLWWDLLKPELAFVWAVKADGFWYKVRGSLIAAAVAVWDMLKAAYKRGLLDAIISIIVKLIRAKLGIPTAARRVKAAFKPVT